MKTLEVLEHILKGKKLRPATIKLYKYALIKFAAYSEEWPTKKVVYEEFINSLTGLKDTTLAGVFRLIKSSSIYMNENWDCVDFMEKAHSPKVLHVERRTFSLSDLMAIIKACPTEEHKLIVLTLLDSGARIGEIAGLRVQDIGEDCFVSTGKTGEHKYRCNSALCLALKKWGESKPSIFTKRNGKPVSGPNLSCKISTLVKNAGIKGNKLGPHTFRHTVGSLIADATGEPLAVQQMLQQSSIQTAMGYIHRSETAKTQRISPIQLMNDGLGIKADNDMTQLALSSPGDIRIQPAEAQPPSSNLVDLLALEYKEVPPNTTIHCKFDYDDIQLLKRTFMGYTATRFSEADGVALKNLYKRMVRLVK